ncbi:MAG: hypothetical protein K2H64_08285 [Desulfovibrio sp.]|nr:hypothetical protein [Desulfovibrio sp.]
MNIISAWWEKICQPLDGFLWRKNIADPIIRPILRNQIFASCFFLILGSALYFAFPWIFWFGCGLGGMTWIVFGWTRLFSGSPPDKFDRTLVLRVLSRFYLRLILFALLLYLALAVASAPPGAIVAGMIAGAALAAALFLYYLRR